MHCIQVCVAVHNVVEVAFHVHQSGGEPLEDTKTSCINTLKVLVIVRKLQCHGVWLDTWQTVGGAEHIVGWPTLGYLTLTNLI